MCRTTSEKLIVGALFVVCLALAAWRLANPPLYPRIDILMESAWYDFGLGEYGYARDEFHTILTMDPENVEARRGKQIIDTLGYPRMNLPLDVALSNIQKLLEDSPDDPYQLMTAGMIAYKQRDYDLAYGYLESSLSVEPDLARSLYLIGLIYRDRDQDERALSAFERSHHLHPQYRPSTRALLNQLSRMGYAQRANSVRLELGNIDSWDLLGRLEKARLMIKNGHLKVANSLLGDILERVNRAAASSSLDDAPWEITEVEGAVLGSRAEKVSYVHAISSILNLLRSEDGDTRIDLDYVKEYPGAMNLLNHDISFMESVSGEYEKKLRNVVLPGR